MRDDSTQVILYLTINISDENIAEDKRKSLMTYITAVQDESNKIVKCEKKKEQQDEKKHYTELISNKQRMERLKTDKANSSDYKKLIRSHTSNPIIQDYIKEKKWSTLTQTLRFMTNKTLLHLGKELWNSVKRNFEN